MNIIPYAITTPDGRLYRVVLNGALPDGPLPEGKQPEECGMLRVDQAVPQGHVQMGWEIVGGIVKAVTVPAPAEPTFKRQETDVILRRLTPRERTALFAARRVSGDIDYLLTRASATGSIRDDDPDFAQGVAALDAAGIIAASRWDALLAPLPMP